MKLLLKKFLIYIKPFLNLRFLLSFGIAWMITNGWAYIFIIIGTKYKIDWMFNIGFFYQAFLWLPFTPEKLITIPLAIFLHTKILTFKDEKTKKLLDEMYIEAKKDINFLKRRKEKSMKFNKQTKLMKIRKVDSNGRVIICKNFLSKINAKEGDKLIVKAKKGLFGKEKIIISKG